MRNEIQPELVRHCLHYKPDTTSTFDLLVDGLKEFALMVAYFGPVHLLDQLGVFVDEPRLPQNICRRVFYLKETKGFIVSVRTQL